MQSIMSIREQEEEAIKNGFEIIKWWDDDERDDADRDFFWAELEDEDEVSDILSSDDEENDELEDDE